MQRHCLALDLKDDPALIAEYTRYHKDVWPEIRDSIRQSGIAEMEIYLTGNRLLMIIEAKDGFSFAAKAAADATNPRVQEWEALMSRFQQLLPWSGAGEKWQPMERIFKLG